MELISVNLVDYNGLKQTIKSKERLHFFSKRDFLKSQPYEKIMRVFKKDKEGKALAVMTGYYLNGNIRQRLEILNSRAKGYYQEWHANGALKLKAYVIDGIADLDDNAAGSWRFEGICSAWNEQGNLLATILYENGEQHGESLYYHPSGELKKKALFEHGKQHGVAEIYAISGEVIEVKNYNQGVLDGVSEVYSLVVDEGAVGGGIANKETANKKEQGNNSKKFLVNKELFDKGLLVEGQYYNLEKELVSSIKEKNGLKTLYHEDKSFSIIEVINGQLEGQVTHHDKEGNITSSYLVKGKKKNGDEVVYYSDYSDFLKREEGNEQDESKEKQKEQEKKLQKQQAKLLIPWVDGVIQGEVKTWYSNGQLESQKEISENAKNGYSTVWYEDGSLMMIEEYSQDQLVSGKYLKKDSNIAFSQVVDGKGICAVFDGSGKLVRKIKYEDGRPVL